MPPIPEKLGETEFINERMTGIKLVRTVDDIIDVLHELTSRIDTIENQLEMKRGKRCPEEDFGFEPKDQPKRWPQHFLQIDPVDGYQIVSYGFETREAAEAYKAKLLADNAQ